ncbi:sigma 54-interacting transcriptional regulator [Mesobacillus maritimus]|uniref:sigma-54 interaction domain-containing protein n=1 Tax=Mesobacillus maritimus TaxID=1643336 RepID=UPI0020423B7D|nr:sigma 54-interacting transcriptional regulator [Mesobacillus maritimus]MCM3671806.1 sigma 54-interacting transcriptional regulator [Mesobacillus maritimus]
MVLLPKISEEFLVAILASIDEAIHAVNTDGVTIYYNEVAAKHDGLRINEVLGKPLLEIFPSLNEKSSTLIKVLKTKKPIYNQSQSFINLYGKKIETINTTLPIFSSGKFLGAVEIAKDYSKIKELAEKLADIQKSLKVKSTKETEPQAHFQFEDILTKNKVFLETKKKAEKLAKSQSPILIFGESGTGKELFVHAIHQASTRQKGPFIAQNCAAIPESLLESILFGTTKGSYTSAVDRPGLFELADGGTLFLDELHTMPLVLQAKLLRVLEDGSVRRVGSTKEQKVNVRVVSAMNIDPLKALENKLLREDLFYRLNVLTFELVPLRERKEDILFLTNRFIQSFNLQLVKTVEGLDEEVSSLFLSHAWPGNVRELKHTIEYMMNLCEERLLTTTDLPPIFKTKIYESSKEKPKNLNTKLHQYEKELIEEALNESGGNIQQAARLLGIPRQTLQYKLKK